MSDALIVRPGEGQCPRCHTLPIYDVHVCRTAAPLDRGEPGYDGIKEVPSSVPGAMTCQHPSCGKSWLEDRTPAGRCPWEHEHEDLHDQEARDAAEDLYEEARQYARVKEQDYIAAQRRGASPSLLDSIADAYFAGATR